jgi:hypothetical protein
MHTPHPDVTLPVGAGGLLRSLTGSGVAETARRRAETGIAMLPRPSGGTRPVTTHDCGDSTPDPTQVTDDAAVPAPAVPVYSPVGEDQ